MKTMEREHREEACGRTGGRATAGIFQVDDDILMD